MRIFFFNTDKRDNPLTLLYDAEQTLPSHPLNFPLEIIQKIVDYLPRSSLPAVASINHAWYNITMPVLYRHIYIRTLPHWNMLVKTFSQIEFSAQFGPCVNSLVLKPSPRLISSQLTSLLNYNVIENDNDLQPSLKGYVRIERVDYDRTGLEGIDTAMTEDNMSLDDVTHENYNEMDTTQKESEWLASVTNQQMMTVLRYCSQLEYLHISGCENLDDQVLLTLAAAKKEKKSKPIIGLWMSLLRSATHAGITGLIHAEKQNSLPQKLKYLDLGFQVLLTDDAIKEIVTYWGKSLTHVRLNSIYQITDTSIIYIAKHCPNLRLIHLVRCWQVNNTALRILASHCKRLVYISVSFLSRANEEGVRHLIQSCPELIWLDITGCGINSLFKSVILEGWANYRREHHLPPIHIQDSSINLL
ncbi:uncharacterized protein BX663DRAFT_521014 [Cokeromyces recurvatus]|uniref:uncharacterized protein n=1 Tax=Cokeromyces recurvatus TaxID=90255 RepID=UPI00221F82C4|nr:uncharacterized protein BX663DRAFT_521014 [Cokeromyces recurvatus]KAI7899469.1 hypothetical protein BX663DRAFT_521014 [Cokeromyces recurvatus]